MSVSDKIPSGEQEEHSLLDYLLLLVFDAQPWAHVNKVMSIR